MLPTWWSANCIFLLPRESVTVTFSAKGVSETGLSIGVSGWNVRESEAAVHVLR